MNILSYIIDKPVETRVAMAYSTTIDRDQLSRKERRTLKEIQIPALDNTNYLILQDEIEVIKPDKKSINYAGKIYIMQDQDIYSSTGSLSATALKYDNLISVGMTTGKLLGRGINPGLFILPNSKFIVKLPTVIDFTDINNAKDVYHDSVEVVFDLPISYHLKMANDDNLYSKEYLIKEDVFFNKMRLFIKEN